MTGAIGLGLRTAAIEAKTFATTDLSTLDPRL
jgi:hypothetical protein